MAGSGIALAQMGNANLNPGTESKVDTKNPGRGPLLILDGEKDHMVPWAIANASYKRQKRNPNVTEIKKMPNRGHSLTIDHGWQEVAQTALDFVKRFDPAKPGSAGLDLPPDSRRDAANEHHVRVCIGSSTSTRSAPESIRRRHVASREDAEEAAR